MFEYATLIFISQIVIVLLEKKQIISRSIVGDIWNTAITKGLNT